MKLIDITVSRFIPGPAAEVYDVWLDPNSPGGPWFGAKRAIVNASVDGLFYFAVDHAGRTWAHYGRFLTLVKGRRIEHTWMSEATHGVETTVEIGLEAREGGTQLTLVHRNVPDDEVGRGHEEGWKFITSALERRFISANPS